MTINYNIGDWIELSCLKKANGNYEAYGCSCCHINKNTLDYFKFKTQIIGLSSSNLLINIKNYYFLNSTKTLKEYKNNVYNTIAEFIDINSKVISINKNCSNIKLIKKPICEKCKI